VHVLSALHGQTYEGGGDRLGLARTEWIPGGQNTSGVLSKRTSCARLSLGAAHANQTGRGPLAQRKMGGCE
jgi:hypothetical protein